MIPVGLDPDRGDLKLREVCEADIRAEGLCVKACDDPQRNRPTCSNEPFRRAPCNWVGRRPAIWDTPSRPPRESETKHDSTRAEFRARPRTTGEAERAAGDTCSARCNFNEPHDPAPRYHSPRMPRPPNGLFAALTLHQLHLVRHTK